MRKRSSIKEGNENRAAFRAIARLTGTTAADFEGKNPAAVVLGRLGGKKGGRARARKLSAKRRVEIAQKAARARWRPKTTG
jgi:hypothetical protein